MSIHLKDVSHTFTSSKGTPTLALDRVSVTAGHGEVVCLVGESGCGKTSLLNIVAGLINCQSGEITIEANDAAARRVSYVFQRPRLLPWRSVRENVVFALRPLRLGREADARADRYLDIVGLTEFADAFPATLSGGMQQRVAVARAFATEPEVLLMDEPFGSLDEFTARSLREAFLRLRDFSQQTTLFVTHNIAEAVTIADRIVVMSPRPGRVCGTVEVNLAHPRSPFTPEFAALQADVMTLMGEQTQW